MIAPVWLVVFAAAEALSRVAWETRGYRTHEFGDSVMLERTARAARTAAASPLTRVGLLTSA